MSVHVMSWVLKQSPAEKIDRLVLIVLADKANDEGDGAWPSTQTIADEARCSIRSAQYALNSLADAGAIEQTGVSEYGTKIWRVLMTDQAADEKFAPRPTAQSTTDSGAKHDENGAKFAPNPSINHPKNQPPPTPPQAGGRKRARSLYDSELLAFRDEHFPGIPVGLVAHYAAQLRSLGHEPTVESLRPLVEKHAPVEDPAA
jgi:hypothetical protein